MKTALMMSWRVTCLASLGTTACTEPDPPIDDPPKMAEGVYADLGEPRPDATPRSSPPSSAVGRWRSAASGPTRAWLRTPPLWGISTTAPYMHDGLAADLAQAIRRHAGEAETATASYEALSPSDEDALLAFLMSL